VDDDFTDTAIEKRTKQPIDMRPYDPPLSPQDTLKIRELPPFDPNPRQSWYDRLYSYLGPNLLMAPNPPEMANDLARHFFGKLLFPMERHEESMWNKERKEKNIGRQLRGPEDDGR
jgi:hypothetical protein